MLISRKVKVKWNGANRRYYESKGYKYTGGRTEFLVSVEDLSKGSNSFVEYQCDYCLGKNQANEKDKSKKFKQYVKYREPLEKDCCSHHDCVSKKIYESYIYNLKKSEKTFGHCFPDFVIQWSDKNGKTPFDYPVSSDEKVHWKCSKNHEWTMTISYRTARDGDCPYCKGILANNENNLLALYPEIAKEWHPTKNGELSPEKVLSKSNKLVWWKCTSDQSHEWKTTVQNRTKGHRCPYCTNRKVNKSNCLDTIHGYLSEEWDFSKNTVSPFNVTSGSSKSVWWKCKEGHEWKTPISKRALNGYNCPLCSSSKGEKIVEKLLSNLNISFIHQHEFEDLKGINGGNLKFDFAVLSNNTLEFLIEYDGEFHFKKIYEEDGHERLIIHDQLKNEYCKRNNIPLLRIPYWEFDNIEEILKKELIKFNLLTPS